MDRALTATSVDRAGGQVTRLTLDDGAVVVDVPSKLVRPNRGDRVQVAVWRHGDPAPDGQPPDLRMRGIVYSADAAAVYVSFGGLLARVPGDGLGDSRVGSDVHLALTVVAAAAG